VTTSPARPYPLCVFQHEGPARSEKKNAVLAGYLAVTGGYVNSAGFVLLGIFTSHVTGNVGRLSIDLSRRDFGGALGAGLMIGAFLVGAIVASAIIESGAFRSRSNAYGTALALVAALLFAFLVLPEAEPGLSRLHDSEAALICSAMGLQNSLVTRLSGAVVRTTHLTGVITDLGIELARWLRWGRAVLSQRLSVPLVIGSVERPAPAKIRLLTIIIVGFGVGAFLGAWGAASLRYGALSIPVAGLALAASYAFAAGRTRA
jgi:uncharacterized membrane protein YoaK (UPF0700 family)